MSKHKNKLPSSVNGVISLDPDTIYTIDEPLVCKKTSKKKLKKLKKQRKNRGKS